MAGGKKFIGPIELVEYHHRKKAGMVTKLRAPCNRPPDVSPKFWFGVTIPDFVEACERQVERMARQDPQRVASEMHFEQPWFHGLISRDEAERGLRASGLRDGQFLVRERNDGSYVLSLCHRNVVWHYAVAIHSTRTRDTFNIENGPLFDNLMDLITFYHCAGGLYCRLLLPCVRSQSRSRTPPPEPIDFDSRRAYSRSRSADSTSRFRDVVNETSSAYTGQSSRHYTDASASRSPREARPLARSRQYLHLQDSIADTDEDSLYFFVRKEGANIFDIRREQLHITGRLGTGQFGSVMKAAYCIHTLRFTVAVKTLKTDVNKETNKKRQLMKEAAIMADLDNQFIIRMIGLCKSDNMLILEYAPHGPLRDYLRTHKEMSMQNIIELMVQVARGMAYLVSKNVVHRDLAARNILLVDQQRAKISDFGLSRDLTFGGKDYYESCAGKNEKWPIKWYAPECLRTRKFDSKSDVWSYGVTLWEATSYAESPYQEIESRNYRRAIEQGKRLSKPDHCPSDIYGLMLHCWAQKREDRPTFEQIVKRFNRMTRLHDDVGCDSDEDVFPRASAASAAAAGGDDGTSSVTTNKSFEVDFDDETFVKQVR